MGLVLMLMVVSAYFMDVVIEGSSLRTVPGEENKLKDKEDLTYPDNYKKDKWDCEPYEKESDIEDFSIDLIELEGIKHEGEKKGRTKNELEDDHVLFVIQGEEFILEEGDTILDKWDIKEVAKNSVLLETENKKFLLKLIPGEEPGREKLPSTSLMKVNHD